MPSPRMTEDEIWSFVTDARTGIMTTLRRDGMPIALPVWFVTLDREIYVHTRGKKLARLRQDPRASFLVEDGTAWKELRAVHFTGQAHVIELEPELVERYRAEVDRKYATSRTASRDMPAATANAYATAIGGLVRFVPDERILHWDNRKLFTTSDELDEEDR
jgi:nitroimidazol reductase NimA-like FMN-containing flavoprotein (pyridoxamine 5'-phosphate oxidase superfamily)